MPQLPQYTSEKALQGLQINNAGAEGWEMAGRRIGENYHQMGQDVAGVINEYDQHEAMQQTISATNGFLAATPDLMKVQQDVLKSGGGAKEYLDAATPVVDKIGTDISNTKAQQYYQMRRAEVLTEGVKAFQAQKSILDSDSLVNTANASSEQAQKIAGDDWTQTGSQMKQLTTTLTGMVANSGAPVTLEGKKNLITDKTTAVANAGLEGLVQQVEGGKMDPDAAMKMVQDPTNPLYSASEAKRSEAEGRIIKAQATNAATQSEIAKIQWPKMLTAVREGDQTAVTAAQQLANTYQSATPKDTPVERARLNSELQDAIDEGRVARTYSNMPQPEIDAQRSTLKAEAIAGDKNADYALKNNEARNAAFTSDRAAYILNTDNVVASRYRAMFDANGNFAPTPQTFAAYADTATAAENRLYPTIQPRVLTNELAAPIDAAMRGIDQTGKGSENAASILSQYANMAGNHWPNIGKELMDRHYINGDQFAASMLVQKPSAAALLPVLLSVSAMNSDQRRALHGITDDAANGAASQVFDMLNKTYANIPDAAEVIAANTSAVAHLLQAKGAPGTSLSKGSLKDAAMSIATTMLLDEYTIKDDTIRITNGNGVDADAVEAGAQKMREDLGGYAVDVPKSYSGLGSDAQRPNYIRQIQQSARFYTTPDDKGVTLYPSPGASAPVMVGGKPLTLTWKQLADMGK